VADNLGEREMNLSKDNTTGLLKISGTLDIDAANTLREALLDCFLQHRDITADLSEVASCDAAVLQVLLACRREGSLAVRAASESVVKTAADLGFSLYESGDDTGGDLQHAV